MYQGKHRCGCDGWRNLLARFAQLTLFGQSPILGAESRQASAISLDSLSIPIGNGRCTQRNTINHKNMQNVQNMQNSQNAETRDSPGRTPGQNQWESENASPRAYTRANAVCPGQTREACPPRFPWGLPWCSPWFSPGQFLSPGVTPAFALVDALGKFPLPRANTSGSAGERCNV